MPTLENLGLRLRKKRGERGIREVAKEIDISHATLSRVERGHLPDLENYEKICRWLGDDVNHLQAEVQSSQQTIRVHFRKKPTTSKETAQALARMIMAADEYLLNEAEAGA